MIVQLQTLIPNCYMCFKSAPFLHDYSLPVNQLQMISLSLLVSPKISLSLLVSPNSSLPYSHYDNFPTIIHLCASSSSATPIVSGVTLSNISQGPIKHCTIDGEWQFSQNLYTNAPWTHLPEVSDGVGQRPLGGDVGGVAGVMVRLQDKQHVSTWAAPGLTRPIT